MKQASLTFPLYDRAERMGILDDGNALIVAPTATGKSYIGREVLRRAIARGEPGTRAYLVPFRALAAEVYDAFLDLLQEDPTAESLAELLPSGVPYHHAGLPKPVRRHVEDAHRGRYLRIVTATPTLAAGVNLPAGMVVVRDVFRFDRVRRLGRQATPLGEVAAATGFDLLLVHQATGRIAKACAADYRTVARWTVEDFLAEEKDRDRWLRSVEEWLGEAEEKKIRLPTKYRGDFETGLEDLSRVCLLYEKAALALGRPDVAKAARELTAAQRAAVYHPAPRLQILACAGSGKTEVLARRAAQFLAEGADPSAIIAFTFTEKAAAELKARIEARAAEADPRFADLPPAGRGMFIGTTHSWALRALQETGGIYEMMDGLAEEQEWVLLFRIARRLGILDLYARLERKPRDKVATAPAVEAFLRSAEVVHNERVDRARKEGVADSITVFNDVLATLGLPGADDEAATRARWGSAASPSCSPSSTTRRGGPRPRRSTASCRPGAPTRPRRTRRWPPTARSRRRRPCWAPPAASST